MKERVEEINPASMTREYLKDQNMKVSKMRINFYDNGPFFYVNLPNDAGLAEIRGHLTKPLVRITPALRKIPVRHWKNGGIYWMDSGEYWDFDLAEPDSLQTIYLFLNPDQE